MPPLQGLPPRNRVGITSEAPLTIDLNEEVTLVDLKPYPLHTRKEAAGSGTRTIIGSLIVLGVCIGFLGSFAAHSRSFDRSARAAAGPASPQKVVLDSAKLPGRATPAAPAAAVAKDVPAPTPSLELDANPVLDLDDVAKRAQATRQAQSRFPKRLPPRR
jgi:hypothetical protein